MLGPSGFSRAYSDQASGKPLIKTLNRPIQDQGGIQLAPCSPMLSKNGARRPGVWAEGSSNGTQKDWNSGRSGLMEMDCRNMPTDYSSALLDQVAAPITDPYRAPERLSRYHSAPSAFLQSLADFQQEVVVSRPMNQLDNSLSSFFSEADLQPLNPSSDASLQQMEAEHSSNSVYDKYMINTRKFDSKFDNRLGKPIGHYDQLGSVNGPIKTAMMQSVYTPSMDVLHENVATTSQMNSQLNAQMNSQLTSQMPSSIGLSSTMGMLGQQDSTHAGQQVGLGNLAQSIANDFSANFTASSGTIAGLTSTRLAHKGGNNSNSLLRQSSSPAGLLAQLSIDVQAMVAKSEKQSLSSPITHSPTESLSGGTSEENGGAGTGPGTPGMMSRMDVGAWEDAQSYVNAWDNPSFAARKRFRDMEIDPLGDSFMPDPLRSSQDHNHPPPLTRHMSLPAPKSKSSTMTDDILQSVPCRIRAKRGCATHPRSIAERVRRTRISERMRKLQELVPNMDKQQTNTADMLDEAVEYVKQLQRQVQELQESKCKGNCREHKDNNPAS